MIHETEWRNLDRPGGYAVSNEGRVRRNAYIDKRGRHRRDAIVTPFFRVLRKSPDTKSLVGIVRLAYGLGCRTARVPDLVAEAFLQYDPHFHEVVLVNGDHSDWRLENLALKPKFAAKLEQRLARLAGEAEPASGEMGGVHAY